MTQETNKKGDAHAPSTGEELFPYMNTTYYYVAMPTFAIIGGIIFVLVNYALNLGWAALAVVIYVFVGGLIVHRIGMRYAKKAR